MSVQALFAAFKVRGVSASEKLVLLVLADHANEKLECYPSQDRLAEYTELSSRTIFTALKSLEKNGLITRQNRKRADGTQSTDIFTLLFAVDKPTKPVAKSASGAGRNGFQTRSQILPKPVAMVATQNLEDLTKKDLTSRTRDPHELGSASAKGEDGAQTRIEAAKAKALFAELTAQLGKSKGLPIKPNRRAA